LKIIRFPHLSTEEEENAVRLSALHGLSWMKRVRMADYELTGQGGKLFTNAVRSDKCNVLVAIKQIMVKL
jgi:hypothetical protein